MGAQDPLRALLPMFKPVREEEATSHTNLVPDTCWPVEEGDAKRMWSVIRGSPRVQPSFPVGLYQDPSSPTGIGISAPRITNLIPEDHPSSQMCWVPGWHFS